LIGNAAPKGAAFLRVAKDKMQWQRYEAAPTLFLYSRIAARLFGLCMTQADFSPDGQLQSSLCPLTDPCQFDIVTRCRNQTMRLIFSAAVEKRALMEGFC
jgi:hypothetical protein